MTPRTPKGKKEDTSTVGGEDAPIGIGGNAASAEMDAEQAAKAATSKRMSEMAKVRWARRDENLVKQAKADEAAASSGGVLVSVPVDLAPVLRELRRKASSGDVSAARELREWLRQFPPDDAGQALGEMDRATRTAVATLLARALEELEAAANVDIPSGIEDGCDSLPSAKRLEVAASATPADEGTPTMSLCATPSTSPDIPPSPAPALASSGYLATPDTNEPLPAGPFGQMTVDDCIAEAEKET
jgi:hypothetical protein